VSSAEDAIRRRRQQAADATELERRQHAQAAANARERLIREVEELVPQALKGLERAGWPEGRLVKIPRFLGSKEIAAWPVGGFAFHSKEDDSVFVNKLFLLSDGRWAYGVSFDINRGSSATPRSFREIVEGFAGTAGRPGMLLVSDLPQGVVERLTELAAEDSARPYRSRS